MKKSKKYMRVSIAKQIFLVFALILSTLSFAQVSTAERQALIDFYNATGGDNWVNTVNNNEPWLINDPNSLVSDWFGVTVNSSNKVTWVSVPNNNLTGQIPASISDLTSLQRLNLGSNNLSGSIQVEISNISTLTFLSLSNNDLTGEIPSGLGNLTGLTALYLDNNNLTGGIPSSFSNLLNLVHLYLNKNNLSGEIPAWLGNMVKLTILYLQQNQFTGNIPAELGNLPLIIRFHLGINQLTGTIPPELGNLTTLQYLYLNNNQLTGGIPLELSNLTNLIWLHLNGNQLTGTIPQGFVSNFTNLQNLDYSWNQLEGPVPSYIASLPSLQRHFIRNNKFTFSDFESEFSAYQNLTGFTYYPQAKVDQEETLQVAPGGNITLTSTALTSTNNSYQWYKNGVAITGATAKDLLIEDATETDAGVYHFTATNSVVTGLTLERNPITLEVTASTDTCGVSETEKQALIDFYNATGGTNWTNNTNWLTTAPVCDWYGVTVIDGKVTGLEFLENNLAGIIPATISNLTNLTQFYLSKNPLTGPIPVEISQLSNLQYLYLHENQLSGEIPSELSQLSNLNILRLHGNQFSGEIPLELGQLINLQYLSLYNNLLSGAIPPELGQLINLKDLSLRSNLLTGTIPIELGQLINLERLSLFSNQLTGTIPPELGQLTNLKDLYLHNNQLIGSIPPSLGQLTDLEILYIQTNQLSDSVPIELGQLTNLTELYINNNSLSGIIPASIAGLVNLTAFNISTNSFAFSDFENEFATYQSLNNFIYTPQANVDDTENQSVVIGQDITLTSTALTSTNNSYQWYKDGVAITGATAKDLVIEDAEETDAGAYHFIATNSIITNLTLERNIITLEVTDPADACNVSQTQKQALVDLYNATNGQGWANTWDLNAPVCEWYGVTVVEDEVRGLDLSTNNLSGIIPSSIGNLLNLETLDLSDNQLTGEIPYSIGGLIQLTTLLLDNNDFTGEIPVSIGSLSGLITLNLSDNNISGTIPISFCNFEVMRELDLSDNNLTGTIIGQVGLIRQLERLDLRNNQLSGNIPSALNSLYRLQFLGVSNNLLSGNIPSGIRNFPDLTEFVFEDNAFVFSDFESYHADFIEKLIIAYTYTPQAKVDATETKTVTTGNTITLTTGLVSMNNLYQWYKDGEIIEGATAKDLVIENAEETDAGVYHFIATNSIITGLELERNPITLSVVNSCEVSADERQLLVNFYNATNGPNWNNTLAGNQAWDITNADSSICDWYGLTVVNNKVVGIDLSGNNLTGQIPQSLGGMINLQTLNLNGNQLSGQIPFTISGLDLSLLDISNNQFIYSGFESQFAQYLANVETFVYAPQANVDQVQDLRIREGESVTLTSTVLTSTNNSYQWFKDGLPIAGATAKDYVIPAVANTDAGEYYFTATNSVVTGLDINRNFIQLDVIALDDTCGVSETERQALIDLYISTNGDNWTNTLAANQPWLINDPDSQVCDWFGVTVVDGRVTELRVFNNNLTGTINPTLGNLSQLDWLQLHDNQITGSLPVEISHLVNLRFLDLYNNLLTGNISPQLYKLNKLIRLQLHRNQLTGTIPPELALLENVQTFYLQNNQLTGTIPVELSLLNNLRFLGLNNNQLTGVIPPALSQLGNLEGLYLNDNQLTGTIPPVLGELSKIEQLYLHNNQLTGIIPVEFNQLASLRVFIVYNNKLSGSIPDDFMQLPALQQVFLNGNELSGELPVAGFSNLTNFHIHANKFVFVGLEDQVSTYVSSLGTAFRYSPQTKVDDEETLSILTGDNITLTSTALTSENNSYQWFKDGVAIDGATSKEYVIENATEADAGVYHFTATNSIVTGLTLERNPITLEINIAGACDISQEERQALIDFYISTDGDNWTNTIAGNQPWLINDPESSVCDWYGVTSNPASRVVKIELPGNNLRGTLPQSFTTLTALTDVQLEQNQMVGGLPSDFGNLTALITFDASHNMMVGVIPQSIGNLSSLTILDLGDNNICCVIPEAIGGLTSLVHLDLGINKFVGSIPDSMWNLANLQTVKLHENTLVGSISPLIGNLQNLQMFWVSENNLSGSIPATIQNIPTLYSVHLDHNSFSGDLPVLIPNFSLPGTDVQINNNRFIFNDFEEEFPDYLANLDIFVYSPQAWVDSPQTISLLFGESVTLTSNQLVSLNNSYQWYKDNVPIPGATSKSYTIEDFSAEDIGSYYFIATNSVVVNLELERHRIELIERVDSDGDGVPDDIDSDIVQSFCTADGFPTIADLVSPVQNTIAFWYLNSEGGSSFLPENEAVYPLYWAEIDPAQPRIPVQIIFDEGAPGNEELNQDYQVFPVNSNPVVEDLVVEGTSITWFNSSTGQTPIPSGTFLTSGSTYYAQEGSNTCRFAVSVFIGVEAPQGDGWQSFCGSEFPTVADLQLEVSNPNNTIIWYTSETGSTTYNETDPLVNGGNYYGAQQAGTVISEERTKVNVSIFDVPPPHSFRSNQVFYAANNPTISDLTVFGSDITWYDFAIGGTAYRDTDPLVDGVTYYAAQSDGTCSSTQRTAVTVSVLDEESITLIGCEKFRPQPGDRYVLSAWVREDGLQVSSSEIRNFSDVSNVFVDLLNHLKDKIFDDKPWERHIPSVYQPLPGTREFDVLVPYIKDATSKNLTIYNFEYVKEKQSVDGPDRVVGFTFSLKSDNTFKITYLTPFVRRSLPVVGTSTLNYRYPLINDALTINFKRAVITNNTLYIYSDFKAEGGILSYNVSDTRSDGYTTSVFNSTVEFFTYSPDPDYEAMEYANALVRLSYQDAEGNEIPLDLSEAEFKPMGAVIDGWQRISSDFTIPLVATNMTISLENNVEQGINTYFDDIRIHPYDGNMKTFVYDPVTQRLQAELDENNYATFYEYDKEGGLVRVKKETERGVYTIQETRSGNSKLNSIDLNE